MPNTRPDPAPRTTAERVLRENAPALLFLAAVHLWLVLEWTVLDRTLVPWYSVVFLVGSWIVAAYAAAKAYREIAASRAAAPSQ